MSRTRVFFVVLALVIITSASLYNLAPEVIPWVALGVMMITLVVLIFGQLTANKTEKTESSATDADTSKNDEATKKRADRRKNAVSYVLNWAFVMGSLIGLFFISIWALDKGCNVAQSIGRDFEEAGKEIKQAGDKFMKERYAEAGLLEVPPPTRNEKLDMELKELSVVGFPGQRFEARWMVSQALAYLELTKPQVQGLIQLQGGRDKVKDWARGYLKQIHIRMSEVALNLIMDELMDTRKVKKASRYLYSGELKPGEVYRLGRFRTNDYFVFKPAGSIEVKFQPFDGEQVQWTRTTKKGRGMVHAKNKGFLMIRLRTDRHKPLKRFNIRKGKPSA